MIICEVLIKSDDAGTLAVLPNAWIYWKENGAFQTLRTDAEGRAKRLREGGVATFPWDYTLSFESEIGAQVEACYSTGATPLSEARLNESTGIFQARSLQLAATGDVPAATVPVSPNQTNTVAASPTAVVALPLVRISLTRPEELSLWPLLWGPVPATHQTDALPQGAALFNGSALTVQEHQAPTTATGVPIRERGLLVEGSIAEGATGARIRVQDSAGNLLSLKANPTAAAADFLPAALGPAASGTKPFTATVLFGNSEAALGPVQIIIQSEGLTPPQAGGFAVHLAGVQVALVDDHSANADGRTAGPVPTSTDELVVVDFLNSPQPQGNPPSPALIIAQARARRMNTYSFANHDRLLDPAQPAGTDNPSIPKPQMPLWMAETHFVGLSRARLEDLMLRRHAANAAAPTTLNISLAFRLRLSWNGPDIGTTSPRRYSYNQDFTHAQAFTLTLGAQDRLDAVDADGSLTAGVNPVPAAPAFPVENRRSAKVFVEGKTRGWGRSQAARLMDTLVAEWQPNIVDNTGREILRGGDGEVSLELSMNAARIHGGMIHSGTAFVAAAATQRDAATPPFRVRGVNPASPANTVINAMVREYYNGHNTLARITILSLDCWMETVRRILAHESGHQFEHRGTTRRRYSGDYYGHEQDMPIFGAPHGYGYGQHDNPPVTDNGAWSFLENIRESVRRIMEDKATTAYTAISAHLPAALDQRIRAVYQREVVRRYNGGTEFTWSGTAWQISPSTAQWADANDHTKGANPLLLYPNNVLDTTVTYSVGTGAATTFPWPITFTTAMFGPETATAP